MIIFRYSVIDFRFSRRLRPDGVIDGDHHIHRHFFISPEKSL